MGIYQLLIGDRGGSLKAIALVMLLAVCGVSSAVAASVQEQIAALKAEKSDAIFSVQHIVNQPVTHLKRTPDMNVSVYSPGWFHEGAMTPSFTTVDVRVTQQFPYLGQQYVTSDLNPGEVFLGSELEFNGMTKYFYTSRNVPKKKLTEAEMLEINRLYRIIGRCDDQLKELQNPPPAWEKAGQWAAANKPAVAVMVGLLLVALFLVRRRKAQTTED